jgi:hypothetical protein
MYWLLKGGLVAEVAALWMSGIKPKSDGAEPAEVQIPADQQIVIGKTTVGTTAVFLVIRAKVLD